MLSLTVSVGFTYARPLNEVTKTRFLPVELLTVIIQIFENLLGSRFLAVFDQKIGQISGQKCLHDLHD